MGWGDELLVISQGKILPTRDYGDTVTLPQQAAVTVRESCPDWGGHRGTTFFVEQRPMVRLIGFRGQPFRPRPFEMDNDNLFGRACGIYPDGRYWPPQLPNILEYVENNWGWKVDQTVKDLVAASRPWR